MYGFSVFRGYTYPLLPVSQKGFYELGFKFAAVLLFNRTVNARFTVIMIISSIVFFGPFILLSMVSVMLVDVPKNDNHW